MNIKMAVWLLGLLLGALGGWNLTVYLATISGGVDPGLQLTLTLLCAFFGLLLAPYLTTVPLRWLRRRLKTMAAVDILAGAIGLILGLIVAALLSIPLSQLPDSLGRLLPSAAAIVCGYVGIYLMVMRRPEFLDILGSLGRVSSTVGAAVGGKGKAAAAPAERYILLDTSAIIDGRIADISQTGFVDGALLVPRFVLQELQRIADSADTLRRNRGRRGLEMLNRLQKDSVVPIHVSEIEAEGADVDNKLISLARLHHYPVITNDYNLNRVAELQGVKVLNINELANAVKPAVLPGEDMRVRVIQEGKEMGQGIGYLDDGTMIVVENGKRHIDRGDVDVTVTRVLQTAAGRMIFATLKEHQRDSAA